MEDFMAISRKRRLPFLEHFSAMDDHRIPGMVVYPLDELLLCALCAVLGGGDDWEDIAFYGEEHLDFLRRFLPYAQGIASARTFRDVFAHLDATTFQRCFTTWMASMLGVVKEVVAIDGKTLRASATDKTAACHVVSAFAHTRGMIMGQRAVTAKSNEITAIPELIAGLALEGSIVTIDAMGCQKSIADQIIKAGADYVLALKGNQGTLHADVRLFFESPPEGVAFITHETLDKGHGRIERRHCSVTSDIDWLKEAHPWMGLHSIARVESEITHKDKTTTEARYYITSLPPDPVRIPAAIRAHWSVESMHWSLDVTFRDDHATARKDHSALNLTTFKRTAYNLFKNNTEKIPLKRKRKKASWNNEFLCSLLVD
jgi:predicted transposase YbfD/YdcC